VRLYLDEDLASKELIARLTTSNHEVVPTLRGAPDQEVWAEAQSRRAAVVTRNAPDFVNLAHETPHHHGLLLVYLDNDPARDMTIAEIALAIDRVSGLASRGLDDQILVLNSFRTP